MKPFHHLTISLFVKEYEGEDLEQWKTTIESLVPFDFEKEKLSLQVERATRHDNSTPIHILKLKLQKHRHIRAFVETIFGKLSKEQVKEIVDNSYVDDDCFFAFRLDKEKIENGIFEVTTSGNCIHCKFLIAAFPANRESAQSTLKEFFATLDEKALHTTE